MTGSQPGRLFPSTSIAGFAFIALFAALPAAAQQKSKLPEGPGRATTEKLCGSCHGTNIFVNRRESREGWSGVVEDMIQRGAKGDDDQWGEVVDYLSEHLSKSTPVARVNVNTADEKDLAAGLGLPDSQAAAIVKYREQNGKFKTIDDLLKVPGIKAAAVQSKKGSIDF
ncbi:helix-hairpin-helix domain-containing protein [uncultured Paludibaculum sp.]|uniref:ComEA family DNA-binding protein n=1 Tax=uncultured Paludibaculum sp. TaxID=1765020 RepID=UPI002AAAC595|nr:helix-hairpin-helix domain-containing protein [uncultured Paludibaculum sp.]